MLYQIITSCIFSNIKRFLLYNHWWPFLIYAKKGDRRVDQLVFHPKFVINGLNKHLNHQIASTPKCTYQWVFGTNSTHYSAFFIFRSKNSVKLIRFCIPFRPSPKLYCLWTGGKRNQWKLGRYGHWSKYIDWK